VDDLRLDASIGDDRRADRGVVAVDDGDSIDRDTVALRLRATRPRASPDLDEYCFPPVSMTAYMEPFGLV
jgi:hypothetical protein